MRLASLPFSALWRHNRKRQPLVISAFCRYSFLVGYSQSTLRTGATYTGSSFINVNGGDVDLQDITVGGDFESGDAYIHFLDAYGRYTAEYMYYLENDFDDNCPAGWYNDEELVEGVSFPSGTGLAIYGLNNKAYVVFSGKVPTADVAVVLRTGATFTANPFPVTLDVQDILVNGTFESGDVYIHILDAYGRYTAEYMYYLEDEFDDDCPAGWYDDEALVSATIAGGEGFAVYGVNNQASIQFPAPEL